MKKPFRALSLVALGCVALVGSSAAVANSPGSYFKIQATSESDPSITATAGIEGVNSGGGEGEMPSSPESALPGGPGDDSALLKQIGCGPLQFRFTEAVQELSETNWELHAQGRDDEITEGYGGWKVAQFLEIPAGIFGDDREGYYFMAGSADLYQTNDFVEMIVNNATINGGLAYQMAYEDTDGRSTAITAGMITHGHNTEGPSYVASYEQPSSGGEYCEAVSQINGVVSSNDGVLPATYMEGITPNVGEQWQVAFIEDGKFSRAGGKPQIERVVHSVNGENPSVVQLTFPEGTEAMSANIDSAESALVDYYAVPPLK